MIEVCIIFLLPLVATKSIPEVLGRGSTPLSIGCLLSAAAIPTSTSRPPIAHLWVLVLGWRLGWRATIGALLARELAWRLLVSHRSG